MSVPVVWGFHISRQSAHEGDEAIFTPRKYSWYSFILELSRPQDHCAVGTIMSMKDSSDTTENRTRDLPVCCAVPQTPSGYHHIQDEPNAEGIFTASSLTLLFSLVTQASPFSLKCVIKMDGSSLHVTNSWSDTNRQYYGSQVLLNFLTPLHGSH